MHPIERLRMVARAEGAGPSLLAREAAGALAGFVGDPAAVVTGCRRLVDRHPEMGTLWWLAARVLAAPDSYGEIERAAAALDADDTAAILAAELPGPVSAVVVGWPEQTAQALRRRGDVEVLAVDFDGEGQALARRLAASGVDAWDVPAAGAAAAVVVSGLVLVEAVSAGVSAGTAGLLACPGSHAAAAVARQAGVPVWAVVGAGRVLPARLWEAQLSHIDSLGHEPWDRTFELVPAALLDVVVGPGGRRDPADLGAAADCPVAPELLRITG
ncbi:MAG TPA: hypothetical protein VFH50_04180 [Acidimicrobiales bacterium]|nr:hypothetical protein [Acidimicrobiales bacterium]